MKLKQLSKARKINAAIWAALTLIMAIYIHESWSDNGCEGFCLWVGVFADSAGVAIIGKCVDCAIRDIQNKQDIDKYEYR